MGIFIDKIDNTEVKVTIDGSSEIMNKDEAMLRVENYLYGLPKTCTPFVSVDDEVFIKYGDEIYPAKVVSITLNSEEDGGYLYSVYCEFKRSGYVCKYKNTYKDSNFGKTIWKQYNEAIRG